MKKRINYSYSNKLLEYDDKLSFNEENKNQYFESNCPVCNSNIKIDVHNNKKGKFYNERDFEEEIEKKYNNGEIDGHEHLDVYLRYHSDKYRDNYDICLKAVQTQVNSFIFVPDKYKDYRMCIEAMTSLAKSIDKYELDWDYMLTPFLIPEDIRTEEFVLEVIDIFNKYDNSFGWYIAYMPVKNITKKLCLKCIQDEMTSLYEIPKEFIDYELCKVGIESGNPMDDIYYNATADVVDQLVNEGYLEKEILVNGRVLIEVSKKYHRY